MVIWIKMKDLFFQKALRRINILEKNKKKFQINRYLDIFILLLQILTQSYSIMIGQKLQI